MSDRTQKDLFEATKRGNLDEVKAIVGAHSDWIDAKDPFLDRRPLMWAAIYGHLPVVEWLAAHGADVNAEDDDNDTALIRAAANGRRPVVELLAAHGADVNAKGFESWTALIWAACNGHLPVVECLAAHGADINAKTKRGDTAIVIAARDGHLPVVECLLTHGADGTTEDQQAQKVIAKVERQHKFTVALNERVAFFDTLAASPVCLLNPHRGYTNRDINSMVRVLVAQRPTDEELEQWRATMLETKAAEAAEREMKAAEAAERETKAAEAAGEHETGRSCVVQ